MLNYGPYQIKTSKTFTFYFVSLIFPTAGIIAISSLPLWLQFVLFLYLFGYGFWIWQKEGSRCHPNALLSLTLQGEGIWVLQTRQGSYAAKLHKNSAITAKVMVLSFQAKKRVFSAVIFQDALNPSAYLQLLTLLKIRKIITANPKLDA